MKGFISPYMTFGVKLNIMGKKCVFNFMKNVAFKEILSKSVHK